MLHIILVHENQMRIHQEHLFSTKNKFFFPTLFQFNIWSKTIETDTNMTSKNCKLNELENKSNFFFSFFFGGGGVGQKTKDELSSLFCETPSSWGDYQNTPCSGFAKGLRFLNIVMTFILHPLYHYNSITEPRAWFFVFPLRRHFYWLPFSFYSIPYRCL